MSFFEIQKQVSALTQQVRLCAPQPAHGSAGGSFASRSLGSSVDFHDHRVYSPGDDPRHLNWNAYARTDVPMMKTFVEEVTPKVEVLIDTSASMSQPVPKLERVWAWLSLIDQSFGKQGVRVRYHNLYGTSLYGELLDAVRWLEKPTASNPAFAELQLRPHSLRLCVSDLLFEEEPQAWLQRLTHQAGPTLLVAPFLDQEVDPAWAGNYEFTDSESGRKEERLINEGVLEAYKRSYQRHFAAWEEACLRHGVTLWRQSVDRSFLEVLKQPQGLGWLAYS